MNREKLKILVRDDWNYDLLEDAAGDLYLWVTCNVSFAYYNVTIKLTEEEKADYERIGQRFLENLAWRIRRGDEEFKHRLIP